MFIPQLRVNVRRSDDTIMVVMIDGADDCRLEPSTIEHGTAKLHFTATINLPNVGDSISEIQTKAVARRYEEFLRHKGIVWGNLKLTDFGVGLVFVYVPTDPISLFEYYGGNLE